MAAGKTDPSELIMQMLPDLLRFCQVFKSSKLMVETMSFVEYKVLTEICTQPMTLTRLSERIGVRPATLSPVIKSMTADTLVTRIQDNNDRRCYMLKITMKGTSSLTRAQNKHLDFWNRFLRQLPDSQVAELLNALRTIAVYSSAIRS